jgi:hypothetical protein
LYAIKLLHEQTNPSSLSDLDAKVNILLNKHAELTDCIYGIIQYIQEQSFEQRQFEMFKRCQMYKDSELE